MYFDEKTSGTHVQNVGLEVQASNAMKIGVGLTNIIRGTLKYTIPHRYANEEHWNYQKVDHIGKLARILRVLTSKSESPSIPKVNVRAGPRLQNANR